MIENSLPNPNRRVIGPIPPRDSSGRMMIGPTLARRPKLNILGEPVRDEHKQPIEEDVDIRPERQYRVFDGSQQPTKGATNGLRLFQVDYGTEPILRVWARNQADAIEVYKREWGVIHFASGETPRVQELKSDAKQS